jgi:hypothetical protein
MTEDANPNSGAVPAAAKSVSEYRSSSDPFRAPTAQSLPEEPPIDAGRRPRIPPMWAFLIGLSPFYATFWSLLILGGFLWTEAIDDVIGFLTHLALLSSIEAAIYQARTLWHGPGRWSIRVPVVSLAIASTALLPGWIGALTNYEGIESTSTLELAAAHLLAAFGASIAAGALFVCGSRDVPRWGVQLPVGGADLAAAAFVCVLFISAAAPFALGAVDLSEFRRTLVYSDLREDMFLQPTAMAAALLLMSATWRFGVRGIGRLKSWKTVLFVLACVPWILMLLVGIVAPVIEGRSRSSIPLMAFIVAIYVIPIARELFLRFAGYRSVNVFAEKRRRRVEALAAEQAESRG